MTTGPHQVAPSKLQQALEEKPLYDEDNNAFLRAVRPSPFGDVSQPVAGDSIAAPMMSSVGMMHAPVMHGTGACYVHHDVVVEEMDEEGGRAMLNGFLHFMWVQNAVDPKTKQLLVDRRTNQPLRGAELLYALREHSGFSIQSKIAQRVVVLNPINDERCCMPVPTKRTKPIALFQGLDGDVAVERTLFYPDIGIVHLSYKFSGWVTHPVQSRMFPFDRQAIKLELVSRDNPPDSIFNPMGDGVGLRIVVSPPSTIVSAFHYVLDETQARLVAPVNVKMSNRMSGSWELGPDPQHLKCLDFSRDGSCPVPSLTIPVQRKVTFYFARIFFPCFVAVSFALVSFGLGATELFAKTAITLGCFGALLLIRFGTANSLPKYTFMTMLDWYYVAAGAAILLIQVFHLVSHSIDATQAATMNLILASVVMSLWFIFHVFLFALRNGNLLRGNWQDIVSKAKVSGPAVAGGRRVFPMRNVPAPEPVQRFAPNEFRHEEEDSNRFLASAKQHQRRPQKPQSPRFDAPIAAPQPTQHGNILEQLAAGNVDEDASWKSRGTRTNSPKYGSNKLKDLQLGSSPSGGSTRMKRTPSKSRMESSGTLKDMFRDNSSRDMGPSSPNSSSGKRNLLEQMSKRNGSSKSIKSSKESSSKLMDILRS